MKRTSFGFGNFDAVQLGEGGKAEREGAGSQPVESSAFLLDEAGPNEARKIIMYGSHTELGPLRDLGKLDRPGSPLHGEKDPIADLDRLYSSGLALPRQSLFRAGGSLSGSAWHRLKWVAAKARKKLTQKQWLIE
jgi:hypothetical protein